MPRKAAGQKAGVLGKWAAMDGKDFRENPRKSLTYSRQGARGTAREPSRPNIPESVR
jgi:hypothetical protein